MSPTGAGGWHGWTGLCAREVLDEIPCAIAGEDRDRRDCDDAAHRSGRGDFIDDAAAGHFNHCSRDFTRHRLGAIARAQAITNELRALGRKVQSFKATADWIEGPLQTPDGSRTIPYESDVQKNTYEIALSGNNFYSRQLRIFAREGGFEHIAIQKGDYARVTRDTLAGTLGRGELNDPIVKPAIQDDLRWLCPWRDFRRVLPDPARPNSRGGDG